MLKMDHSELIRNTNFSDQREQIEIYATAQLQVEHLTNMVKEQYDTFQMHAQQHERERQNLETTITKLEKALDQSQTQKQKLEREMATKNDSLLEKINQMTEEKENAFKQHMESMQQQFQKLNEQMQQTNQTINESYIQGN